MASETDASGLYSSLVKWLENCLALGGTLTFDPSTVADGNSIADCLVQLAPDFFTSTWRGKIISETAGNWKLRHNNLKKIQRSVMDYYKQVLHISLEKFSQPDLTKIAESGSHDDMSRLIQLMLGIAINCDHKDMYIQAIMSMQQEVQHVVMGAIQDLMSYQAPAMVAGDDYQVLEDEHKQVVGELQKLRVEREQLLQQNHDYQVQVKATQEEVGDLSSEIELLKGKLKEAQTSAGITGESKAIQLQRQLDQVKNEKFRTEAERDELKHKAEEAEGQVRELYQKCRELTQENQEIPILRDSLEEMKYLQSKVKNYESVISQYKKKLEDAQELRKKVKAMEDKNMMYMQQNMDLEEELRRLSGARMQIETQKQKLQELENLLAQERLHSLEASQDNEEKQQALDSLRSELAQVKRERDSLHMQVPGTPVSGEFPMFPPAPGGRHRTPFESSSSFEPPDLGGGVGGLGLEEAFTPEMREKMARLEKENEIMRRRLDSSNLTESLEPSLLVGSSKDEDALRRKVAEQMVTIERLERDKKDNNERLNQLEARSKKFENEVATLEEAKKTKEVEIEKYKKYLSKAKKIIESFGGSAKSAPEDALEIQALKNQLKEKEKNIERVEREYSQDRLAWEREEKLVVSAWYELGLKMHRKYSNERLVNQFGSSFLAQQRQSLYKRPVAINTSMASTASPASSSGDV